VVGNSNFQGLVDGSMSVGSFGTLDGGFIAFLADGVIVDGRDLEKRGRMVFLRIWSIRNSGDVSVDKYL